MRCLVFLFACCFGLNSSAQTGSVIINCVDQSSQKPLVACIQIENDTIAASGCTDIDGKRKFSKIQAGPIKVNITLNGDTLIPRVAFIQANQMLQLTIQISGHGNAVVAGSNTFEASSKGESISGPARARYHGSISGATITREDIARLPARTAASTLQISEVMVTAYSVPLIRLDGGMCCAYQYLREDLLNMPMRSGINIASTVGGTRLNEENGGMNIRGARSDANTYYLDGFRVNNLNGIPKSMMNKVTVYTGGLPAKYGDVTGGVIAIETKPIGVIPRSLVHFNRYEEEETIPEVASNTPSKPELKPTAPPKPQPVAIPVTSQVMPRQVVQDEISLNSFSIDRFTPIYENDFLSPKVNPNSTFSIDVDRASWTYVQNQYKHGLTISRDAVKLEEMVNAFQYEKVKVPKDELMHVEIERSKCAWNENSELVTVHLKAMDLPEDMKRKAHNFVFLIDVSGSMQSYNKLGLLREGLMNFVKTLNDDDRVAIVTYAGSSGVVLEPTLCSDKDKILNSLNRLTAGGGTNGIGGIKSAYDLAEQNFNAELNNRIILCTDGDFNVGISNPKELEEFIATRRGCGIYLTALGFGMGNYRNDILESLADNGDGNHFYINGLAECKRVLVDEIGNLLNIARDVKLNVEFNPQMVAEYRLIGYENRLLKPRDFTDDTKDAGEIGYGHRVTAVYEIVPGVATGTKADTTLSNRTKMEKNDFAIVKLRYKKFEDESSIERTYSLNERAGYKKNELLNTVISFGLLLRDSAFKGEMTKEALSEMASKLGKSDEDVEKLKEMIARYLVI